MNSSYVLSDDEETDLQSAYYSLFNDSDEKPTVQTVAQVVLLGLTFVVVLVTNVKMLGCLVCFNDMRTPINIYFVNLGVADMVFAFGMPFISYTRLSQSWCLGEIFCKLLSYTEFLAASVILWSLAFVSVERYKCTTIIAYKNSMNGFKALLISCVIWILAILISLPIIFAFDVKVTNDETIKVCTLVLPRAKITDISFWFGVVIVSIAFFLPIGLLVYHYLWLLRIIFKGRHRWAVGCVVQGMDAETERDVGRRDSEVSIVSALINWAGRKSSEASITCQSRQFRLGSLSKQEEIRKRKHVRMIRLLSFTVFSVLVMWLPISLLLVLLLINVRSNETSNVQSFFLSSHHFVWALIIAQSSAALNPSLCGVSGSCCEFFKRNFLGRLANLLGHFARSKWLSSSQGSVMELHSPLEDSR